MSALGLSFLLDIFTGYVGFGLAFYAGCALLAAFWMRRRHTLVSRPTLAEMLRTYGGMSLLVLLQIMERLWASFYYGHSPSRVLRIVIPMLYLWLGNSVFRAVRQDMDDELTIKSKMTKTAMKSARTSSAA